MALTGCQNGLELAVDLRTDLVVGRDFDTVEVTADGEVTSTPAEGSYDDAVRVYEATGLAPGRHDVTVRLLEAGAPVASRNFVVRLDDSLIFTAVITRSCRGVTCPSTRSGPTETECFGGRCVDPTCIVSGRDTCPEPECSRDGDCTESVACARAVCDEGICLQTAPPDACPPDEYCDLDEGCRVTEPACDCDDGILCTTDECSSGECSHAPNDAACSTGVAPLCDPDAASADPSTGCLDATCGVARAVVYRYYSSSLGEHFYATSAIDDPVPTEYERPEGAAFTVMTTVASTLTATPPLYRCIAGGNHILTTTPITCTSDARMLGYVVDPSGTTTCEGDVRLVEFTGPSGNHFYTVSETEGASAGLTRVGYVGYVFLSL